VRGLRRWGTGHQPWRMGGRARAAGVPRGPTSSLHHRTACANRLYRFRRQMRSWQSFASSGVVWPARQSRSDALGVDKLSP
jgi:hypothetical protein